MPHSQAVAVCRNSLEAVMAWKRRRRRWILRLMAAAIMRLVVASRANRNKGVKATDTMSATAGKTHSAHLQEATRGRGLTCTLWLGK